jgi:hypothetical protein
MSQPLHPRHKDPDDHLFDKSLDGPERRLIVMGNRKIYALHGNLTPDVNPKTVTTLTELFRLK